jgi:hypothetical protein
MTKDELIKHMQNVLDDVIKQDEDNWEQLLEAGEYEEIDKDKAWHNGYMSAITTVRSLLND